MTVAAPLRIAASRDDAGRLVEQDVALAFGGPDTPAIDADVVGGHGLRAHLADRRAVDA